MLSLRASCCKEPVTHRTRENRMTVPERLLSRLEMVSGSVTTFSNPFSLTDLFHNAKELHLGFQRQAKVWGPFLPGLPCVCPQSPKTTCSPYTHRPLGTPHGSHTTGATSRGASSLVSSRLGGWTESLFKALQVKQGLLWFQSEGLGRLAKCRS